MGTKCYCESPLIDVNVSKPSLMLIQTRDPNVSWACLTSNKGNVGWREADAVLSSIFSSEATNKRKFSQSFELKKKLTPLFDSEKGFSSGSTLDPNDSYVLSDGGTVNLLSRSYGVYNINELGLQKCTSSSEDETDHSEKTYRCASQ
uniref:Uncharacterized protein n=1 Tax=Salix viminalis TaxID=40686 RepID=A0A6N2MAW7_SALVM